jgi:hypothetical protein
MRMTGTGQVGIGPRFNNANQPKSTLHQHQQNAASSWMQITNQYMNTPAAIQTGPTAINATNGFRFGILGNNQKIKNGNAYVYNQEERHLIFSTNHVTPTDAQFTNERMRITSISAPTNLTNGGNAAFGVWNPGALPNQDVTRVAISHNPATPVTRPLALLHLGYNTGNPLTPFLGPTTDGWRKWMDVGTFSSEGTDNAYFGLKKETGFNNDRQDAVISWGDNYAPTNQFGLPTGIDKLRIIFTTPETGQAAAGPGAMSTANGLEFVRYVPFHNSSLNVNDPRTGFGDFENLLPVGTINPGNTIEINSIMNGFNAAANTGVTGSYVGSTGASGLRFRDLTSQSAIVPSTETAVSHNKVLSVDNLGNVVLIAAMPGPVGPAGGIVNAQNGLSLLNPSTVEFGNAVGGTAATLLNNRQIPMAGNTILSNGQGTVKVGQNAAVANLAGIIPTFEVNNSSNANNNVGLLVQDNSVNGQSNRTGLDIKMNLNSSSPDLIALNIEHSNNNYNQTNGLPSKLISVKGLDWNQNGLQDDEVFGVRSSGYAGFGLDQSYYSRATLGIGNLSQGTSSFFNVANPLTGFNGLTSLFAYTKNPPLNQRVRTADIYAEGNISVEGLAAKAVLFGSGLSFGLRGEGAGNTTQGVNEANIGVYGVASNPTGGWNVGGYFVANTSNYANYAIYARTAGTGVNDYAARFDGNVNVNGGYYLGGISFTSDQQFKTNVDTITNPLSILNQLKPRSYNFDTTNVYGLNFSSKKQYGFVAQDVEQILPELVNNQHKPADLDSAGVVIHQAINYKSLNYNAFFAILTAAMQKQQNVIDSLKHAVDSLTTKVNTKDSIQDARLAALEAAIDRCCTNNTTRNSNTNINQLDIELSDKDAIVLNQNVPNPFAEQTTITYNVPESVIKAQIIFYNNAGQIIQTVDVKTRGKGKVNVFASDLSSGLYHYTLVADGKVVASKKMVRE